MALGEAGKGMSDTQWYCPDADENGLVTMAVLKRRAAAMNRDEFVAAYPVPGLLFTYREEEASGSDPFQEPEDSRVQLLTLTIESAAILRYLNRLMFLSKKPGNPYPHIISVGRSPKNDLSIGVETVSKVHGYFAREEAGWCFTDHSSTNGSQLNGQVLKSGHKYSLRDQDVLKLGLQVMLEYLPPAALYDHLR